MFSFSQYALKVEFILPVNPVEQVGREQSILGGGAVVSISGFMVGRLFLLLCADFIAL